MPQVDRGWRDRAACLGVDPELFFPVGDPESGPVVAQVAEAKAVCARCPVVGECLSFALVEISEGVAGGLSAQERVQLRRSRVCGVPAGGSRAGLAEGVVALLVAGEPVSGASPLELAHAAVRLYLAGHRAGGIATRLGVNVRQVHRWLERHRAGRPLVPGVGRAGRMSA
jgi:WhiB family transcriptional regulator, redox-sensing transcriptional regulator